MPGDGDGEQEQRSRGRSRQGGSRQGRQHRRGNHEGTIRQRKADGRWEAMISLPDGSRKSVYGETRREAAEKLAALRRSLEAGLPVADDRLSLGAYLDGWLASIQPTVRDTTYQRHIDYVRLHIVPALGHVRLSKLTARMVQDFYADRLSAGGLSTTTVNHLHGTLHKSLQAAVRMDLVPRNVATLVDVPPMARHEIRPLSRDEARRFVTAVTANGDVRDEALFILAITSGMRQGEMLGLRWRDVDLDRGVLHVRSSVHRHRQTGQWTLTEPKTARSRRQVALARPAIASLRRHKARQEEIERLAGAGVGAGAGGSEGHTSEVGGSGNQEERERWRDLVFRTARGEPRTAYSVYWQLQVILRRAGLPRIRFHDLRHTCATLLLSAHVAAKVVADLLGHASVSITLDVYSHALPEMHRDAVAAIGAMLDPSSTSISSSSGDLSRAVYVESSAAPVEQASKEAPDERF
jgi:integrase